MLKKRTISLSFVAAVITRPVRVECVCVCVCRSALSLPLSPSLESALTSSSSKEQLPCAQQCSAVHQLLFKQTNNSQGPESGPSCYCCFKQLFNCLVPCAAVAASFTQTWSSSSFPISWLSTAMLLAVVSPCRVVVVVF